MGVVFALVMFIGALVAAVTFARRQLMAQLWRGRDASGAPY
jgi:hypothetical protein